MNSVNKQIIIGYYNSSRLDYVAPYAQLYIAYNAWYRCITGCSTDREAIKNLKESTMVWMNHLDEFVIWRLASYIDRIAELTYSHPLYGAGWRGAVENRDDWRGLIEFWYRVRCELFHGALGTIKYHHREYVRLAYVSLSIFMDSVVSKLSANYPLLSGEKAL